MAHRAVDAVLGPRTIKHETVATEAAASTPAPAPTANTFGGSDACLVHSKAFQDVCSFPASLLSWIFILILIHEWCVSGVH